MGYWFDLSQFDKKADTRLKVLPAIPDTKWKKPDFFPDLTGCSAIAVDLETRETDFDHGPGWGRGTGHIVGIAVSGIWPDNSRWKKYYPIRHEVEPEDNCDPALVLAWLKEQLETDIPKIGANLQYDLGWLASSGIFVRGQLLDVQFAEAIIDEQALVNLDVLAHKYLGRGKTDDVVKDWIMRAYSPNVSEWRGDLWRAPPRLVGPYAEDDADLPISILWEQWGLLNLAGQLDLFHMECDSIRMLIRMRLPGVTVDVAKAEVLSKEIEATVPGLYAELGRKYGYTITKANSGDQLGKLFDYAGVPYLRTGAGRPSFKKEWLEALEHPLGDEILAIRMHEKIKSTFLDGYILDRHVNGKIFCSFHPLKGEDGGAKTGRYSSSDPNLQNVPVRTKLGKRIRELFIPDYGHQLYHKKDHSQIEYRLFAHFASGPGSHEIRERYNNDPTTDYHYDTMVAVAPMLGKILVSMTVDEIASFRKPVKNINFGLLYGQTERSLAYKAGMSLADSKIFFEAYHGARPFVKSTMKAIEAEVQHYGYINTLLNRRVYFNQWEAADYHQRMGPMAYHEALRYYGSDIIRAFAYRAVNYRFQGSAADVLKQGMLDCYNSGVFDYTGLPKLQVHDELVWSQIDDSPQQTEAYRFISHTLENAIKLSIPLKVDSGTGPNWASIN